MSAATARTLAVYARRQLGRAALVLALAAAACGDDDDDGDGANTGNDAAAPTADCDLTCPRGTRRVAARESRITIDLDGGSFIEQTSAKCTLTCDARVKCCGRERWSRAAYECDRPCAAGEAPGATDGGR